MVANLQSKQEPSVVPWDMLKTAIVAQTASLEAMLELDLMSMETLLQRSIAVIILFA